MPTLASRVLEGKGGKEDPGDVGHGDSTTKQIETEEEEEKEEQSVKMAHTQ